MKRWVLRRDLKVTIGQCSLWCIVGITVWKEIDNIHTIYYDIINDTCLVIILSAKLTTRTRLKIDSWWFYRCIDVATAHLYSRRLPRFKQLEQVLHPPLLPKTLWILWKLSKSLLGVLWQIVGANTEELSLAVILKSVCHPVHGHQGAKKSSLSFLRKQLFFWTSFSH